MADLENWLNTEAVNGRQSRFHYIFASAFGLFLSLAAWLLISPGSPVYEYLRHTYDLPGTEVLNLVSVVQIVPAVLAALVSGNFHGGSDAIYWVLVFAQWFVVGLGLSYVVSIIVPKRKSFNKTDPSSEMSR